MALMATVDFGRHSEDYASYRPGFPASFYDRLGSMVALHGSQALDLATGPGTVALELGARGCSVVGIDTAPEQISAAERLAKEGELHGLLRFQVAPAEATSVPDGAFDLVTAGQCWHWFDSATVLRESHRVLRPGGTLVVAYYSYLAEHSPVARDTEQLVLEFNPSWTMSGWSGVFPELMEDLLRGGFELVEQFCYQHPEEFSHQRWRGRMRTCNGVGSGGLTPDEVLRFDEALARLLQERYPDPLVVEHRIWCVVVREPA
jgi:ubiquinone/menaquinone biosynthesis C-methylase UbiE